jgi:uridine kinase
VAADDFHNVRAIRHRRGRSSPAGFWLDSYNYERLRADVLDPLGTGGSREYRPAAHDLRTDEILSPPARTAPPGAVLILDGLFLHRDELAGVWDLSIFLDVPFDVTAQRMAGRDGTSPDPRHPSLLRYVAAQEPRTALPGRCNQISSRERGVSAG